MHATTFILAAFLAIVRFAAAGSPPACLIAALGQQPNPADISGLCGTLQPAMEGNLTKVCSGSSLSAAYNAFSSTCLGAGVTVAALPTATASGSGSASANATPTGSSTVSGTGSAASPSASDKKNAATGMSPQPLLLALSGLFATAIACLAIL